MRKRLPVILDTDIGGDIDDVWALAVLLAIPEWDIKLISTCGGDTEYRARIVCKFLDALGRADIPVAIGRDTGDYTGPSQQRWVSDYNLSAYGGELYRSASEAIAGIILQSREPVTVISIGPASNLADVLDSNPAVTANSRIVGMYGSVEVGYLGAESPSREANVLQDVPSLQKVVQSGWEFHMVPLDCCGRFLLNGEDYQTVKNSPCRLAQLVMENYRIWQEDYIGGAVKFDIETQSSILFDIPPVFYALDAGLFDCEPISITVRDDAMTVTDEDGQRIYWVRSIKNERELAARVTRLLTTENSWGKCPATNPGSALEEVG